VDMLEGVYLKHRRHRNSILVSGRPCGLDPEEGAAVWK
jgi:hypothetical protein